MKSVARALPCLLACSVAAFALSSPVSATSTFTATGTVYAMGQPVSGQAVTVVRHTVLGTEAGVQTVYTNPSGVFSATWTASGSVLYVTVTVNGFKNAIVEQSSRTLSWCCGGTKQFGLWTRPGCPPGAPGDNDSDGIPDATEDSLLQTFAPQVRLHPNEVNLPASVDWILPRSTLRYSHLGGCSDHAILPFGAPTYGTGTANDITRQQHQSTSGCSDSGEFHSSNSYSPKSREGFFLQQHDSDHNGASSRDWVVYGHVYPHYTGQVVVQYWFFYSYNDGFIWGDHESDWEHVLFVVNPNTLQVSDVRYSQHNDPKTYRWDEIALYNGHPIVYSAKGSHANYRAYTAGINGNNCIEGPPWEKCDDGPIFWNTWDSVAFGGIVNVGESCYPRNADWLLYSGRWGEIGEFDETSGKKGPAYQTNFWRYRGSPELCGNGLDDDVDGTLDEPKPYCTDPPVPEADLSIADLNPTLFPGGFGGPVLAEPGDSIFVKGSIVNAGRTSGPFVTRVALSTDNAYSASDPELFTVSFTTGLGQTSVSSVNTEAAYALPSLPDGLYYLVGKADAGDQVTEAYDLEANNAVTAEYQVRIDSLALKLENFNDGVANGFTTSGGTWDASGKYYLATGTGSADPAIAVVPSSEVGVTMEFDYWVTDQGLGTAYHPYLGAIVRYQDPIHHLRADTYRNTSTGTFYVRLLAQNGGGPSDAQVLANVAMPSTLDPGLHHFEIQDLGCQIIASLDGTTVTATYNGGYAPGYRGFFVAYGTQVGFDNFRISQTADADHDGYTTVCHDCNDNNFNVNPGRTENCCTADDDDCDGSYNENCSGSNCGGGGCFAAGTAITMADGGKRAIESLRPGDEVLSYDEASGKLVPGKVLETFRHDSPREFVRVDGTLLVTPNHQLFTNRTWLPVDGLMPRDALTVLATEGVSQQQVSSVDRVERNLTIHDIEVSGNHNYFANGILVHNKVRPTNPGPNP